MNKSVKPKITLQIYTDVKCFGPGVAQLLIGVKEYQSLSSAAKSMNMAYSKAWTIIKTCETELGFKLLETTIGGRKGGGATLTDNAERLLSEYISVCGEVNMYANKLFDDRLSWLNK